MLSACFITKNEAQNLPRAINSIAAIVGEIIVVDTGSTDETRAVAAQLGAKVYSYVWQDDFAAARNYALSKASGDWIIFLDADEYFLPQSLPHIVAYTDKFKHKAVDALGCRWINIDVYNDNRVLGSCVQTKIFRNKKGLCYTRAIHEQLVNKLGKLQVCFLTDELVIHHTGYSGNIVRSKLERNLKILLNQVEKFGLQAMDCRYLADCYYGLRDYEQSFRYAKAHIEKWTDSLEPPSGTYAIMLDSLRRVTSDSEMLKAAYQQAIQKLPQYPEFYLYYAEYLATQFEYDEALEFYLRALDVYYQKKLPEYADDNFSGAVGLCCAKAAAVYRRRREYESAGQFYQLALQQDKYNGTILQEYLRLTRGQQAMTEQAGSFLLTLYKGDERAEEFLAGQLLSWPQLAAICLPQAIVGRESAQLIAWLAQKNTAIINKYCQQRLLELRG